MIIIYNILTCVVLEDCFICLFLIFFGIHPTLLVVVGVSAAMNELRPCAPISLKHLLAQELIKGLQAVSDSLLRYNTTRMLRESESGLFLALCRAFIEVLFLLIELIVIAMFLLIILTAFSLIICEPPPS